MSPEAWEGFWVFLGILGLLIAFGLAFCLGGALFLLPLSGLRAPRKESVHETTAHDPRETDDCGMPTC
jgi:hypothetical protein